MRTASRLRLHAGAGVPSALKAAYWTAGPSSFGPGCDFPQRGHVGCGSYVDEPLMMATGSKGAATCRYLHANHLYSVAAVTDAAGAVVERYRYDAYGKRTVVKPDGTVTETSAVGNTVGFTGYRIDGETGLSYARARMYSVELGRFVGRDPKQYVDGMGLYAGYFAVNGVDPSGKNVKVTCDNCDKTQQKDLEDLSGMAEEKIRKASLALRSNNAEISGIVHRDYENWFNENDSQSARRSLDRGYQGMLYDQLNDREWKFHIYQCPEKCTDGGDKCKKNGKDLIAFVENKKMPINICPNFWGRTQQDGRWTIIHELTHNFLKSNDLRGYYSIAGYVDVVDPNSPLVTNADTLTGFTNEIGSVQ